MEKATTTKPGRNALPAEERRVSLSCRIHPSTDETLTALSSIYGGKGLAVDNAIATLKNILASQPKVDVPPISLQGCAGQKEE